MSGIASIVKGREDTRPQPNSRTSVPNKEIWFKDGDQAFVTSVATGEQDDKYLDEIEMYTFRHGNRFANLLKDDDVDLSLVPSDSRPQRKFAFWAYVHEIIHTTKRKDDWEEVEGPSGKKIFKEAINDHKIICLTFGRNDYLFSQLVDVYNDWGSLNKGVIRIKRTGTGMYDTSYTIAATARTAEAPKMDEELPTIKEYFKERYSALWTPAGTNSTSGSFEGKGPAEEREVKVESTSDDLF